MLKTTVCRMLSLAALSLTAQLVSARDSGNSVQGTRYLALGDSLAFGYNPSNPTDLSNSVGYPTIVAQAIRRRLANVSCPGESSGSFIQEGAPDFGCNQWKQANDPLFVEYTGSQLTYAVSYINSHPSLDLITIDIGGNDLAVLQAGCNLKVTCELKGLPDTLAQLGANLTHIYSALRGTGYSGPIVALTYYSFNYNDPLTTGAFAQLNSVITKVSAPFNVTIADGFGAFSTVSALAGFDPCAAGLLVKTATGCDTHPSLFGQWVLASTVLSVANIK
jgi:lysophospholipase L1-like esterase